MPALFLDFDGTLCDSLAAMRAAYDAFLAAFGIAGTAAEFDRLNGPPLRQVVDLLQRTHDLPGSPEALHAAYLELALAAVGTAPPAPGARDVLEGARAGGWPVAVVTSGLAANVRGWLARHALDRLVADVVGAEDVSAGKPDPEPYLLAMHRLGSEAADGLAVEDSVLGATAALGAGLGTWLIGAAAPDALRADPRFLGLLPDLAALAEATDGFRCARPILPGP